jgi:hypothetical protein
MDFVEGNSKSDRAPDAEASADTLVLAAVARRLIEHLQVRSDVQNIDLMNLAGFCRNCLAKWYSEESKTLYADKAKNEENNGSSTEVSIEEAKMIVYGMDYNTWKAQYQN